MTAPVTGITPIFGLEYIVEGEPAKYTRQKLQRSMERVEAALAQGPASPPGAADLNAVTGRVNTLEQARPRHHRRRYYVGTAVPIPNAAVTVVPLNTDEAATSIVGTDVVVSGNGLRVLSPGLYLAAATLRLSGGTTSSRSLVLQVNGVTKSDGGKDNVTSTRLDRTWPLLLAANDVVTLCVWQDGGAGVTAVGVAAADTGLQLSKVWAA